ncbi:MAG TPA: tetratricopeptide repeat protein, partial [Vicinamibacteria bacterium]
MPLIGAILAGLWMTFAVASFSAAHPVQSVEDAPTFEDAITRALVAEREGRLEEATLAFQEAARLRPDHPRVYYSMAWTLLQRGFLTDALVAVDRALALDVNEPLFHLLQGTIFHELGNFRE